ncbi:MAG: 2-dehydro-3-deoxy-D-gluconate 5-dehydrogenase KduD [Xanthomonas sp.]
MSDLSAFSLEGQTIVVTGANTGIGQGIAVSAARAGARVVGVGRSPLDETAALIGDANFLPHLADLADIDIAKTLIGILWSRYGAIDGLVNNAGIIRRADSAEHSEADWDDVFDINLKSLFFLSQAFGTRVLTEGRRGKIVNIASLLSFQGGIRVAAYTASKHGVAGVTKTMANEWAARGINVNAIAPGYIESNNTAALRADPDRSSAILGRIPAGRWGKPSDIGDAAVFLLAPASDYAHGAIVPVDGGWLGR